nr:Crp/Fnr family transcriptional regulator [Propylenella binzhouense]
MTFDPGSLILHEGEEADSLYTVVSGWAIRYKTLADARRQILKFVLPGDFLGLQSSIFAAAEHSVEALTEVRTCVFLRKRFWEMQERHPQLGYEMVWVAASDEQHLDAALLSVGQRSALERAAYLLLDLYIRAEERELVVNETVLFPFNQQHLADALGLSLVHTNKVIGRLRTMKLIKWEGRAFQLLDRAGMEAVAKWEARANAVPRAFL